MKKSIRKTRFVKLISKIISILPFAIAIVSVVFISYYLLYKNISLLMGKYESLSEENEKIISILLPILIEFLISCVLSIFKFHKKINIAYKVLEYKLYTFLNNKNINYWLKIKLINIFNRNHLLSYDSQSKVITAFIESIKNLENIQNKLFYVIGENNSGKTSMISLLCERVVSDKKYFNLLNGKIIYICKSYNDKQIQEFINSYMYGRFANCYIFIDDIGQFSLISQRALWKNIISPIIKNEIYHSKMIIIITDFSNSYVRNKLSNKIYKKYDEFEIINEPLDVLELEKKNNTIIKKYNITDKEILIWIDNIVESKGISIIDILFSKNNTSKIKRLFMCFIVASRYSKIVNIKLVKEMFIGLGYTSLQFDYLLVRLLQNSIFVIFPFLKNYVYINDSVTQFFLHLYRKSDCYIDVLKQFEIKCNFEDNDEEKWLLNCEKSLLYNIHNSKSNEQLFAKAFNIGNFAFLLEELKKLTLVYNYSHEKFYKELGYLHEKVGKRNEAIYYLNKYLDTIVDINEIYQTQLLLFEIEHHYNQDTTQIVKISKSDNSFLSLQAEYWIEHIKIEKGEFNYDYLMKTIDKYLKIKEHENKLNYFHILRRMYSDLARSYYLRGEINKKHFIKFRDSMKNSSLRYNHVEFDEFYSLLTKAHYLHYDLIFQLGFYGFYKHDCDDEYGINPDLDTITQIALDEYSYCENNFKNYGDKAWLTISIRKNELALSRELQYIKIIEELEELKTKFQNSNNNLHLAFIDCVLCKAYFLSYYMNYSTFGDEKNMKTCRNLLSEALTFYNDFGNTYGIYRINFISAVIDFYENIQVNANEAVQKFKNAMGKLKNDEYHRELEMIESILNSDKVSTDFIAKFFRFYPIILQ